MRLFNRTASALIGPAGSEGLLIRGLRFSFQIEKAITSDPNSMVLKVYNLSDRTIGRIEESGNVVILRAGYDGQEEVVWKGDVTKVSHERQSADRVTTIESNDGARAVEQGRVSASFGPGASISEIVEELKTSLSVGAVVGEIKGSLADTFANGFSMEGLAKDAMDKIAAKLDSDWSIQDNELVIMPKGQWSSEAAVLLNKSTGMVGAPTKEEDGRVKVVSLLQPKIRPTRRVKIESEYVAGVFKVDRVVHDGDTHGAAWSTTAEAAEAA